MRIEKFQPKREGSGRRGIGLLVVAAVVFFASIARAAEPAVISFTLDFPNSEPEHYSITVRADGHGKYECSGRISAESDDKDTYETEFVFSEATRSRIFELAAQSHYFTGKIDSGNKKIAFTGAKKLTYTDGERNNAAEYNYSPAPVIQQLTALFQNVSATLGFGHRLSYFHRYQKLALDQELKRMEADALSGNLVELQAVKPVLQEIYDDASVMNVVRARAQRIMEMKPVVAAGR